MRGNIISYCPFHYAQTEKKRRSVTFGVALRLCNLDISELMDYFTSSNSTSSTSFSFALGCCGPACAPG